MNEEAEKTAIEQTNKPSLSDSEKSKNEMNIDNQINELLPKLPENEKKRINEININLESKRNRLKSLNQKDDENKNSLEESIFTLEREKLRLIQFYSLKLKWNEKQKKIIWEEKTIDNLKTSDILYLKKTWADLAKLLLTNDKDVTKEVSSEKINEWDNFVVNYGENDCLNAAIWAWDILKPEIRKIRVNWIEWERKCSPRPWYYTLEWKYLPIYDWDKIEIIKKWEVTNEEVEMENKSSNELFEQMRVDDLIDWMNATDLEEDIDISWRIEEIKQKRLEERKKWDIYKEFKKESFMSTFWEVVKRESSKYDIPQDIAINLMYKESGFNPYIKSTDSSAYGLWQFITGTWKQVKNFPEFTNIDLDKQNPEHQIMAVFAYLNYLKWLKWCTNEEAVIYYHTWPGFNENSLNKAMRANRDIAKKMHWKSVQAYMEAAKEYYFG